MTKILVLKTDPNKKCTKASRANKKIKKEELEKYLNDESIMGIDKMTQRQAAKIKYEEACQILLTKNVLEEVEVNPKSEKINCLDNTFAELKKIAQKHNVSYVGSKKDICNRLKNIGYDISDNITENNNIKCYKHKKTDCNQDDDCQWMPQIINKQKQFDKKLLIERLKIIDNLNNISSPNYNSYTLEDIKKILYEKGLLQKQSSCIDKTRINEK